MAGNGHRSGPIDPELLEDLDAFVPQPVAQLKFGGTTYPVPHYRDLVVEKVLTFVEIWNDESGDSRANLDRMWRRLQLLVPDLPETAKDKLTLNAIDRVLTKATARPPGPPVVSEVGSASASPSPSTGASIPATASAA